MKLLQIKKDGKLIFKNTALGFVLLLGTVSLFSDMTYEAARSITGPYLAILGASGTAVGIVAGFGEFIGYTLRLLSGWLVDYSKKYWLLIFIGYLLNLLAIPALAFANSWQTAAMLIIIERVGKAIRTPARDTMLSYATHKLGRGWGFGIHQAFDQTGGLLGPLLITSVLLFNGSYSQGFLFLFFPAGLAILILFFSKTIYPTPQDLEPTHINFTTKKFPKIFWLYLVASMMIAAGFADYPLIAYHFEKLSIIKPIWIPVFYAISMGISAICALILGRYYDRKGLTVLIVASFISLFFSPFVFFGGFTMILIGMILWGIGMGSQRSLMKAIIGHMIAKDKRGLAYGIFNAGFGIAWFAGSSIIGILYDRSILSLVLFSIIIQLVSIPIFFKVRKNQDIFFRSNTTR